MTEREKEIKCIGLKSKSFRFVAERGDSAQVNYVDKIDVAYQLRPMPNTSALTQKDATKTQIQPERTLPLTTPTPRYQTLEYDRNEIK